MLLVSTVLHCNATIKFKDLVLLEFKDIVTNSNCCHNVSSSQVRYTLNPELFISFVLIIN